MGHGIGKKAIKDFENRCLKGPFSNYACRQSYWENFLQDIFSTLDSYFVNRITVVYGHPLLSNSLGLKGIQEESALVQKYLETTHSLVLCLMSFIKNTSSETDSQESTLADYVTMFNSLDSLGEGRIFSIIDLPKDLHRLLSQYIANRILEESNQEKAELEKENERLSGKLARLLQSQENHPHTVRSIHDSTKRRVAIATASTSVNTEARLQEAKKENTHLRSMLQKI